MGKKKTKQGAIWEKMGTHNPHSWVMMVGTEG